MEVLDDQATALTNFEVMKTLQQIKNKENKRPKRDRINNLNTVIFEALKYIKMTPAAHQTEESIKECMEALRPFKLTAAETLQMVNTRPTQQVDIELLVEESEERLATEEQLEALLTAVTSTLPERAGKKAVVVKQELKEEPMEE